MTKFRKELNVRQWRAIQALWDAASELVEDRDADAEYMKGVLFKYLLKMMAAFPTSEGRR